MKTTNWQTKALTLFIAAVALCLSAACRDLDANNEVLSTQTATWKTIREATYTPNREANQTPTRRPTETSTAKTTDASTREVTQIPTSESTETPTMEPTATPTSESTEESTRDPTETPTREPAGAPTKEATETPADETHPKPDGCSTESPELTSRLNTSEEEYESHWRNIERTLRVLNKYESLFRHQPNATDVTTGFLRDGNGGQTDTWGITVWVTKKVDQSSLPAEDRISDSLEDVSVKIVEGAFPRSTATSCDYSMCGANLEEGEKSMETTRENTPERIHKVRLKYAPLFWRQPNVYAVSEGFLRDGKGGWLDIVGINVTVTKKVDQSTLPPDDRIPDCIEGIRVKITEELSRGEAIPGFPIDELIVDNDKEKEESNGTD